MGFGVLGGDTRQEKLAAWLAEQGQRTVTWGLGGDGPLEEALAQDCLVLPLPVSRDGERLHTPLGREILALEDLWSRLRPGQRIFGGQVTAEMVRAVQAQGAVIEDYFRREELQVRNAVSTAEGAIQRAMERTDRTLHRMPCLVMGYGRIGKVLSHRLAGLGAIVTVSARKSADLAWIEAMGHRAVKTGEAPLEDFRLIFNTIPAPVLGEPQLRRLREDCLLIDLASAPGGVDRQAAEALGISAVQALALPGQAAPRTAAEAIGQTIFTILEEQIQ